MQQRPMRLNPWCPDWYLWTLASAHFALGELGETVAIVRRMRDPSQGRRLLVASYAHLGMMCEAKAEAREILASQPDFTISDWAARLPHNRERVPFEHFVEGLRRAGLPTG
jgi:adenylate cyclase